MKGKIIKQAQKTQLGQDPQVPNPAATDPESGNILARLLKKGSVKSQVIPTNYSERVTREAARFSPPVRPQSSVIASLGYGSGGTVPGAPGPSFPVPPPPIEPSQLLINASDYLMINATDYFLIK